jgi:hypothetical protein
VFDHVSAADEVGRCISALAFIKLRDKVYSAFLSRLRPDVTGVKSQPAIAPTLAEQAEKISLSTAHFDNGFAHQVVSVNEVVRKLR